MPRPITELYDPATGFLDSPHANGFTAQVKRQFCDLLAQSHGEHSITSLAEKMGVTHNTVLRHMAEDKAFAAEITAAKRWYAHRVEGVLQQCALDPKKTLDRIAYLRAYMPERYARTELNQAPQVQINFSDDALAKITDRITKVKQAVEAEVVDAVTSDHRQVTNYQSSQSVSGIDGVR